MRRSRTVSPAALDASGRCLGHYQLYQLARQDIHRGLRFLQHDGLRIGRHVVKQQAIKHAPRPPPEAGSILKDETRGALYDTLPVDQDDVSGHALVFQLLGSLNSLPCACRSLAQSYWELLQSLLMAGMTMVLLPRWALLYNVHMN